MENFVHRTTKMDRKNRCFRHGNNTQKGKENVVAHALSRKDEDITSYSISVAILEWLDEIRSEYTKDPETSTIINNPSHDSKFEWKMISFGIKGGFI